VVKFATKNLDKMEAAKKLADVPKEKPSAQGLIAKARKLSNECNDDAGAARIYELAAKLHSDDSYTLNECAWFLLTCKDEKVRDPQKALPLARKAVKETKEEEGHVLDTLAKALHDTGDLAGAAKYSKMAAEKSPGNQDVAERAKEYAKDAASVGSGSKQ
jgi:tetratricopeptide (TPR) repeat protein